MRFLVIGDGHLRLALETYAVSLGLADDVTFTGTLDDAENFYPALDICALTSLNEGTPLTLIEAMANERAVVATGVGGVVDLLGGLDPQLLRRPRGWQACERGALVESGDAEAFADALGYLVGNAELRAQVGARGRAFVESNYSVARLVADIVKLYEELRAEGAGHDERAAGAARRIAT
jgi:glycosyltransferase involved in cell wall biosynthesis